jgi:hypothetical protein
MLLDSVKDKEGKDNYTELFHPGNLSQRAFKAFNDLS